MTQKKYASEAALSEAIIKKLKGRPRVRCQKIKGSPYGMRTLDILGSAGGLFFWLEVKQPGEEPTKNQYLTMREWIDDGAHATWTESVAGAEMFIDALLEESVSRKGGITKEKMLEGFHVC